MEWFDCGEDKELDLIEAKQDAWMAATTYALMVVSSYSKLEDKYAVLTSTWWNKTRFSSFG